MDEFANAMAEVAKQIREWAEVMLIFTGLTTLFSFLCVCLLGYVAWRISQPVKIER